MIKANPVHAPMRIQNVSHLVLTFAVKIERTENQLPKQASSWRLIWYKESAEPKKLQEHNGKSTFINRVFNPKPLKVMIWNSRYKAILYSKMHLTCISQSQLHNICQDYWWYITTYSCLGKTNLNEKEELNEETAAVNQVRPFKKNNPSYSIGKHTLEAISYFWTFICDM